MWAVALGNVDAFDLLAAYPLTDVKYIPLHRPLSQPHAAPTPSHRCIRSLAALHCTWSLLTTG